MKRNLATYVGLGGFGCLALTGGALAQDALHEKLAAAKQAAAQNRQALRAYSWLQQMEASYKGEAKKTTVNSCRYAQDGSVQKTLVSSSPAPDEKGGRRGKIAKNPAVAVLGLPTSKLAIRIQNTDYQRVAP